MHAHDKRVGQVVLALRQEIFDPLDDNGDGVLVRCSFASEVAFFRIHSMSRLMHLLSVPYCMHLGDSSHTC